MSKEDEKKLEKMLADFEKADPAAGKNFRTLLGETPALKTNLIDAIGKGNLDSIGPLPPNAPPQALGAYVAQTKALVISTSLLGATDKDPQLANTMRMVLTHESEHAINKQPILDAQKAFEDKLTALAQGPSPHDYTAILKERGATDRVREATDQVGGFNAVADFVRKQNPTATPAQLNRKLYDASPEMQPYFDVTGTAPNQTYAPKTGITLDKDGHLAKTPANIEAIGKYFYDARPYQQQYGTQELVTALKAEAAEQARHAGDPTYKAPDVRVNLHELGLDALRGRLPAGVTDTSPGLAPVAPSPTTPTTPSPTTPTPGATTPGATTPSPGAPPAPISPTTPYTAAPEPALYLQAVAGLEKLGSGAGLNGRAELTGAAAAMAVKAQADGLNRIDVVVASTNGKGLFAVEGSLDAVHAPRSYIDRAAAIAQPAEQNLAQLRASPTPVAPTVAAPEQAIAGPQR